MPTAALSLTARTWSLPLPRRRTFDLGERPAVMGILNVTPDSFSDGGRYLETDRAVERALEMLEQGADLLDLGAESTRPGGGVYGQGARDVSPTEESDRLLPVLEALRPETSVPLSVDTRKSQVAREALAAGADLINDVSGLADPELGRVVAEAGCPLVLMHSRGSLETMQRDIRFEHLLPEIRQDLADGLDRAEKLGVDREHVIVDPGIGFGKTAEQNLEILGRLDELAPLGRPVLVGASRKSFLGAVTGAPPDQRAAGSLAAVAWAVRHRAALVRVHDIRETVHFLRVDEAITQTAEGSR